jgi:hypothetical protein
VLKRYGVIRNSCVYPKKNKLTFFQCLICLDEYEEEDEIRVMGCRHAFHRGCVDTWLQTGKNNCPACRSMGVASTSTATSTQTTTTASVPRSPLV